ncbi:MAG TPA: hypothetical protein VIW23_07260 [Candidatus Acidoferrum sp.]|jgi:hypothetical protein
MSNADNFKRWKSDLDARCPKRETVHPKELFLMQLKDALIVWWNKLEAKAIPKTLTWGETCLEFAFDDEPESKAIMKSFVNHYPEYEGDLELFVINEWGFKSDVMQSARQHEFVLRAWERKNVEKLKLDKCGLGEQHPNEQWQKDNAYAWRRIQEDVFENLPYTFGRLDIAYETFSAAGLYGGMKFAAEQTE